MTKPVIAELPLEAHTYAITYSDGLMDAGKRTGQQIDLPALVDSCLQERARPTARQLADFLLEKALELDANRPSDDMAALVLGIHPSPEHDSTRITPQVRRMDLHIPI
jgi:serine phosphatase RsbU (regulator of sigma subunit)